MNCLNKKKNWESFNYGKADNRVEPLVVKNEIVEKKEVHLTTKPKSIPSSDTQRLKSYKIIKLKKHRRKVRFLLDPNIEYDNSNECPIDVEESTVNDSVIHFRDGRTGKERSFCTKERCLWQFVESNLWTDYIRITEGTQSRSLLEHLNKMHFERKIKIFKSIEYTESNELLESFYRRAGVKMKVPFEHKRKTRNQKQIISCHRITREYYCPLSSPFPTPMNSEERLQLFEVIYSSFGNLIFKKINEETKNKERFGPHWRKIKTGWNVINYMKKQNLFHKFDSRDEVIEAPQAHNDRSLSESNIEDNKKINFEKKMEVDLLSEASIVANSNQFVTEVFKTNDVEKIASNSSITELAAGCQQNLAAECRLANSCKNEEESDVALTTSFSAVKVTSEETLSERNEINNINCTHKRLSTMVNVGSHAFKTPEISSNCSSSISDIDSGTEFESTCPIFSYSNASTLDENSLASFSTTNSENYFIPQINETFYLDCFRAMNDYEVVRESITNSVDWATITEFVIRKVKPT